MYERQVQSLGCVYPLEKEMATHSSILTQEIPWAGEPGGLQSIGSQRVGHDYSDLAMCMRERERDKEKNEDNVEKNGEENKKMLQLKFKNSLNLIKTSLLFSFSRGKEKKIYKITNSD